MPTSFHSPSDPGSAAHPPHAEHHFASTVEVTPWSRRHVWSQERGQMKAPKHKATAHEGARARRVVHGPTGAELQLRFQRPELDRMPSYLTMKAIRP
jgi:hypothetical protein